MDNEEPSVNPAPGLNVEAANFAPPAVPPPAAGNLRLPEFWPENPRGWFAMAEAQFLLRRITAGVDRYCHVLTTLPRNSYRLVSHLVEDVPGDDSYELLKSALLAAHQLSDYQRIELLSKVEPLGARKPSDLLAAMTELCPRHHLDSPFFFFFFLQRLPREIRVLLSEEDPKDIRSIAEKADRLVALHVPQLHDTVAALQLSSDEDTADVAAVKPRKKAAKPGKRRGKPGKQPADNPRATMCWYHASFGDKAHSCTAPCSWAEN
jgi:hypothetical protein